MRARAPAAGHAVGAAEEVAAERIGARTCPATAASLCHSAISNREGRRMNVNDSLRRFGLVPPDEMLPEVRALLAQEVHAERQGHPRTEDLALLCCVQLFARGSLEDVLRIWDAKRSGFDLGCALDVQLLCGPGLQETKRHLAGFKDPIAADALAFIEQCEIAGDFAGFSPESRLNEYRRYFGME